MTWHTCFTQQRKTLLIGIGILLFAAFWVVTTRGQYKTWEERKQEIETAKKEILELEQRLTQATERVEAEQLHLQIAELSLKAEWGADKPLQHLEQVSDATTETARLCMLLWHAASRLQSSGIYWRSWKRVEWERVKPAYERILRLAPESDLARRALYQLGRYYLAHQDFAGWRENREEFIRRFGSKQPFYAAVAAKEIGDSFLFEGNPGKAQQQYERLLSRRTEKELRGELYLRLLQSSWVKSSPTPERELTAWREALANNLGFQDYQEYDLAPLHAWLDQLLQENKSIALSLPLSEWPERKELSHYDFTMRFYQGMFDHVQLKFRAGLFEPLNKETRVRSNVARVKTDMRTIAVALEAYIVDWCGGYPPVKAGGLRLLTGCPTVEPLKGKTPWETDLDRTLDGPGLVRYLKLVPLDPFGRKPGDLYLYNPTTNGWILVSPGPDGSFEVDPATEYRDTIAQPTSTLLVKGYDPTNGTLSPGDIFRVKQ